MIVFVGTPNIQSRVNRLNEKLKKTELSVIKINEINKIFEKVLMDHWSTFRFLTFSENEALINFIEENSVSLFDK